MIRFNRSTKRSIRQKIWGRLNLVHAASIFQKRMFSFRKIWPFYQWALNSSQFFLSASKHKTFNLSTRRTTNLTYLKPKSILGSILMVKVQSNRMCVESCMNKCLNNLWESSLIWLRLQNLAHRFHLVTFTLWISKLMGLEIHLLTLSNNMFLRY